MKIVRVIALTIAALGTAGIAAAPVAFAYPSKVKSACRGDFKRFCGKYSDNSASLRQCMRASRGQLSGRCFDALKDAGYR